MTTDCNHAWRAGDWQRSSLPDGTNARLHILYECERCGEQMVSHQMTEQYNDDGMWLLLPMTACRASDALAWPVATDAPEGEQ